jgi:hypothetical protein
VTRSATFTAGESLANRLAVHAYRVVTDGLLRLVTELVHVLFALLFRLPCTVTVRMTRETVVELVAIECQRVEIVRVTSRRFANISLVTFFAFLVLTRIFAPVVCFEKERRT